MRSTKLLLMTVVIGIFLVAGCHELGHLDGLGDYGTLSNEIVGEVQNIDTHSRQIEIRTDAGRTSSIRYDDNTRVIYRQRNYEVSNLERGDYVAARVQQDRDGQNYTDTVTVRESVQDRGSTSAGRLDRIEGRVEYLDDRRGTFEIRDSRNRLIVVSVAFNAPRAVTDRFNRLRDGDFVRIEGRTVSAARFELENFL
jgi:exosome complex RNA-binding protein Csl4